ncbi:MAG: glycosyltransferase family A protein [Bryobacteraceae bacterium]|jgi:glycosyltransferase involved in cell wall biosynthesis
MRITVVVPVFNKARRLKRCLDSVASQSFEDFEVIVVDDGSTDGSGILAEGYPDRRFRAIHQRNAGPGAARNRGIREARGEYIAFLDADDNWLPPYLETNLRILDNHPEAAAVSGAWIDYPAQTPCVGTWSRRGISRGVRQIAPSTSGNLFAAMVTFMNPCSAVVRADVLRQEGGFEEGGCRFGEDATLWLKLLLHHPVYFHLEPLTELHREAAELSGNYAGPRPVEPFLSNPDAVTRVCPPALLAPLHRFYAVRTCKTACMLSYWGEWRRARALRRRFVSIRDWRASLFFAALAAGTPFGALAGRVWRGLHPGFPRTPAARAAARSASTGR